MGNEPVPIQSLINRYGGLIMDVVWHIVQDREDTRDIYQETFLRYHTALLRGTDISAPRGWLCRTAMNLALNRQRSKQQEQSYQEGFAGLEDSDPGRSIHPEHTVLVGQIRTMALRLPDRQREVFILRNFEELSYEEIGSLLACTPETARANEYQALKKIRGWLVENKQTRSSAK